MTGCPVVVDNSVAMRWFHPMGRKSDLDRADRVLDAIGEGAIVPSVPIIFLLEFVNVLHELSRRKALAGEVESALSQWQQLGFVVTRESHGYWEYMRDLHALCAEHPLSAYDAAYLELALRLRCPLLTLDKTLAKAARQAGVPLDLP